MQGGRVDLTTKIPSPPLTSVLETDWRVTPTSSVELDILVTVGSVVVPPWAATPRTRVNMIARADADTILTGGNSFVQRI